MKLRRWMGLTMAIGLLLMSGLIVAAGQASAQDGTPASGETFPVNIRFLNAMTSLGEIDVYVNGDQEEQRVVEGLEYGSVSDTFEGTAPLTAVVIKQNVNVGFDRWIYDTIVPTEAGKQYVVVVSDLLVIPIEMDLTSTGTDEVRARLVHAAAQAPSVDAYASVAGSPFNIGELVPAVVDLRFGSATDAREIVAGTFDLRLTATGTDTIALEVPGVALDAGQVYTFVLIGTPGSTDEPLALVTITEAASM